MSNYSETARALARAAKLAGALPGPQVAESSEEGSLPDNQEGRHGGQIPSRVPFNRRQREISTLTEEELYLAYAQANNRLVGLTTQDPNYERYTSYRVALERFIEARQPEPDPEPRQPPIVPDEEDSLPWERDVSFRNDTGFRFRPHPNDTPES